MQAVPFTPLAIGRGRRATLGKALACLLACVTNQAVWAAPDEPLLETSPLFIAGHDGYSTYRIPALAVTPGGVLLAACAGRFDSASDWANADVMIRRSADGGKVWDEQQVLVNDGTNTVDNPTFIVDEQHRVVYLMYQINYARAYVKSSTDDGATWTPPQEITGAFEEFRRRDGFPWRVLAMGPGHGIVLANGRLLVPVWLATERSHRPSVAATIYSDDRGSTWRAGEIIIRSTEATRNPSEHQLVELADGRVLANIRTESATHRRTIVSSADGISGWSEPELAPDLYEPICMASMVRLPAAGADGQTTLLFSNPSPIADPSSLPDGAAGSRDRRNLAVRMSGDDGRTWPIVRVVEPGPSAYSDLAVLADGSIGLLYESAHVGGDGPYGCIKFARFDKGWLTQAAGRE